MLYGLGYGYKILTTTFVFQPLLPRIEQPRNISRPGQLLLLTMTSAKYDFGVVGLGRMGASIAGSLALRGCRVAMYDKSHFDREKGWNILSADMKTHVEQVSIYVRDDV